MEVDLINQSYLSYLNMPVSQPSRKSISEMDTTDDRIITFRQTQNHDRYRFLHSSWYLRINVESLHV